MSNFRKIQLISFLLVGFVLTSCLKQDAPDSAPTVITLEPSDVKLTSFVMTGDVTNEGFNATKDRGFVWSLTNKNPTVSDNKKSIGFGKGQFTHLIENLNPNTNYYYKAFASNDKGTSYGELKTVKTADFALAKLTTEPVSNISATFVTLQGKLVDNGGIELIEKGFCVSKNPNPSINDIRVKSSNNDVGSFAIVLKALDPQTKYFVRAYAQNAKGISYGNELTFTTATATIPTVGTNDFQEITQNSVRAGVEIDNNGGADITEFGVCLSTNRLPTIFDRKVVLGNTNSPGKMDNIFGLMANTTYYLRGYAINRVGVAYGPERSFSTINPVQNTLRNGLVAYYPFNGNANDVSSNGNNGTNKGATLTADRYNNSNSAFNFSNNGLIRTNRAINDVVNNFTVSVWATTKKQAPNKLQGFMGDASGPAIVHPTHGITWDSGSAGIGIIFGINQIQIVEHADSYLFHSLVYSGNFTGWNHIVLVYENHIPKLFLNGKLVAIGLKSNISSIRPSNGYCGWNSYTESGFGKSFNPGAFNSANQYDGVIDDYAIWNRVLSPEDINLLYQTNLQP